MSEEELSSLDKMQLEFLVKRISNKYRNHCELIEYNKFIENLKEDGEWLNYEWKEQV